MAARGNVRVVAACALAAAAVLMAPCGSLPASAQVAMPPEPAPGSPDGRAPALEAAVSSPRAARDGDRSHYFVRLEGPSLVAILRASRASGAPPASPGTLEALRASMQRRQASIADSLRRSGAEVIGGYQAAQNGLQILATREQAAAAAATTGVLSVAPVPVASLALDRSVAHIGADRVQRELGLDGSGVTVAVIDTGIDYTHVAFGGPGTIDAYAANDPSSVEEGSFPTTKVVGGYDFAGAAYTESCPPEAPPGDCSRTPEPDDDPLDGPGGHGTHVAGIAAGAAADGVVPGTAPGAGLVALKVFGNPFGYAWTTALWGLAVEWATSHNLGLDVAGTPPDGRIHVLNLSVGGPWSGAMAVADDLVDAAVESGMTVVVAAGNSGNRPYIVNQPGTAGRAVSVAGSEPPGETALLVRAEWTDGSTGSRLNPEPIAIEGGRDWLPRLAETGPRSGRLAWYGLACGDDPPAQDVSGRIALIERGECAFYDKVWNAQRRGAVAALVYTDLRDKTVMGCVEPSDCANAPSIPAAMIDREPGLSLRERAEAPGSVVTVTLDDAHRAAITDAAMTLSSRGPARAGAGVKPQITAPGGNIRSADASTGRGVVAYSGTSMAAPFVSGIACLLWQQDLARPADARVGALGIAAKALNYARPVIREGDPSTGPLVPVARQGAGLANAYGSVRGAAIARSDAGIAEISFGNVHVPDDPSNATYEARRSLRIANTSDARRRYQLAVRTTRGAGAPAGLTVTVPSAPITIAPGSESAAEVRLVVDTRRIADWTLGDTLTLADEARFRSLELDGWVTITELDDQDQPVADGDALGVPYLALPRRHGCVLAETTEAFALRAGRTIDQAWRNRCDTSGRVAAYHLVGQDGAESAADATFATAVDIGEVGMRWGPADRDDPLSPTVVEWAVRTVGPRRTPFDTEFHLFVDVDGDRQFDSALANLPEKIGDDYTGRWWVVSAPVAYTGGSPGLDMSRASVAGLLAFDVDESVTRLAVPGESIGIGPLPVAGPIGLGLEAIAVGQDAPITESYPGYDVWPDGLGQGGAATFDLNLADCVEVTGPVGNRLDRFGEAVTVPPGAVLGTSIHLSDACAAAAEGGSAGLMFDYPDNMPGPAQAEVRPGVVSSGFAPTKAFLPFSATD